MSSRPAPLGDDVLVRKTSRQLALRASALVGLAMLLLVTLVTLIVVRGQTASANALLRTTAATADDVGDPPAGTWLVLTSSKGTATSPGLPQDLTSALEQQRQHAGGLRITELRTADSNHFRVATRRRATGPVQVVQVVQNLTPEYAERSRLVKVMALASVLALLFALGLGLLLARGAVRPFAQALALQRAFVADASHELRTPLTLLSTRAQLLDAGVQGSTAFPEQVRADSTAVVADVHRLGEVLEDLLVAADPRTQRELVPLRVDVVARECVDSALAHARSTGVLLQFEDPATDVPRDLEVMAADAALRRAVLSLIDNAIDHTPPTGRVTVSCRRDRRDVVLTVTDSGPGVDAAAAPVVMRRFHSGGQRAGRAHYGLGLALTQDVANRFGGQLRLVPGSTGATFELVLPCSGSKLTGS